MIYAAILACEIGFWVVLLAGLTVRYPLGRPRLGGWLLVCVPLVDLALLTVTVLDLRHGATASAAHALAAVYLGVSVAFGHRMVAWADVRFAHRFAGGPAPAPKSSDPHVRSRLALGQTGRHALAWAVGSFLLVTGILLVDDVERTAALLQVALGWTVVLLADGLWSGIGHLWHRRARSRPVAAR